MYLYPTLKPVSSNAAKVSDLHFPQYVLVNVFHSASLL